MQRRNKKILKKKHLKKIIDNFQTPEKILKLIYNLRTYWEHSICENSEILQKVICFIDLLSESSKENFFFWAVKID